MLERGINSSSLAAVFPFVHTNIMDAGGKLFGMYNNYPFILDIWKRGADYTNSNGMIIGKPGGGKSFFIGKNAEVKFWNAIAEVTLMQNMYLHAEYAFAAEGEGPYAEDPDDTWTVSLNYVF